ncbi:MAG: nuclear transport factor 2 family protein [Deltaproteobacteria bacterium]|nr:nuclear transport factor 2 family protein [Deltaproteobacteria bacterium]
MTSEAEKRDSEAIRAHIDGLFQAFIRKDREAIRRGHTTDWRGFQVKSTHLVRGIDDYMKAADVSLATFRGTRHEILDIDIKIYGDMAVVFYLAMYWVHGNDDGEQSIRLRSVDVYRREGNRWNQCGSNICLLPEESAS